jgi:hypothetical protein
MWKGFQTFSGNHEDCLSIARQEETKMKTCTCEDYEVYVLCSVSASENITQIFYPSVLIGFPLGVLPKIAQMNSSKVFPR